MLTYYDWNFSPNCLKTKILLNELGIPYTQKDVDRPVLQSAEYRGLFPTGMAPAIQDGELRLSESGAIALYLAEKHGGALIPKDPERRARMHQAVQLEAALLAPTVGGEGLFGELYKPTAEQSAPRIAALRQRAQEVARILGAVLGERAYFADELSLGDIQLYPAVAKSIEGGAFADPPRNLVAWRERMTARPSVAAARKQYTLFQ